MNKIKVIISGGGTGGHIFPAISIANELKERLPDVDILFVGALGRMEMERVPAAGYRIEGLPVMGFPRKLSLKMVTFFVKLFKSLNKARQTIRDFQPDVAVGVGGYASGPVLKAAVRKGIPAILQEQNSYAGITNKLLAPKVRKICVAYPGMEKYFPAEKIVLTGNPVRKNLLEKIEDKNKALEYFGLKAARPVVLMIGGSLGARTLNESIFANLERIEKSGVQIIWQTGTYYYHEIQEKFKNGKPENLKISEFVNRMDLAYAVADVVVSRAGAGTISELCLLGKPSVLVPSPNVAEDHQTKNAMALVKSNAAVMIRDTEAKERLWNETFRLVNDKKQLQALSGNILKLAKPNAAKEIVNVILNELEQ
ncbi:MAG: undecaprenyldiphospho-muramoylpentapeptide beta-N-acetylglucosaminyltransferase [Prolixibacteraceae bacterium]|jgi:UDP-N-acetylglucosamine--N-acetylmuramyl-(pentapeptide) pyrophosphoryl-undecaprenol N-acetylglucosamine transferase|nr:undecaprenyldiphospho-muramoylpentapeptide beta-N-acetylglucosaminyltransferase [Prolixibacteraceae bacterium]